MAGSVVLLADGDLEVEGPGLARKDEIADIAKAVQVFKENAQRMRTMEAEQVEAGRRAEAEKRRAMDELAGRFESTVGGLVRTLAGHFDEVRRRADAMTPATHAARPGARGVAG